MPEITPKISIIVPVYNAEEYLMDCVYSILNQSIRDFEIILVDDGSSDNSAEICKILCDRDCRVSYLYKDNGGVSSARNLGLNLAKGEYIKFNDADDTMPRTALEDLLDEAEAKGADIVYGKHCIITDNGRYERQKIIDNSSSTSILKSLISSVDTAVWDCLFRRDLLENIKFDTNLSIGEDFRFLIEAFYNAKRISSVDKIVYNYNRMNEASAMASGKNNSILRRKAETYNSIRTYLSSQELYPLLEEDLAIRCLESVQEMSLYNELHTSFIECVPEKRKYINKTSLSAKMKFFSLCLCNKLGFIVVLYNSLRSLMKCKY